MTKTEFANESCEACNKLTPRLDLNQAMQLTLGLPGWYITSEEQLRKRWTFKNFAEPLKFVLAISELAEKEGHHPNINFGWGYVDITIWTHAVNGLSRNDFILAAKIDTLKK